MTGDWTAVAEELQHHLPRMRVEIVDGDAGWPEVEPLEHEVYPPEVLAKIVWRDVVWAHADKRVLVRDGGVVCHAGIYLRDALNEGAPVRIAGIGGVLTATASRRRGYASAAMRRAAEEMAADGVDFGMLFCEPFNEPFYAGLGWSKFDGRVMCEQPSGRIVFDLMAAMTLEIRRKPASRVIDLCGLPW